MAHRKSNFVIQIPDFPWGLILLELLVVLSWYQNYDFDKIYPHHHHLQVPQDQHWSDTLAKPKTSGNIQQHVINGKSGKLIEDWNCQNINKKMNKWFNIPLKY